MFVPFFQLSVSFKFSFIQFHFPYFQTEAEKVLQTRVEKLASILSGEVSIDLHLQFLIRSNHADMLILKNTKDAIRVSICHTATVIANGFMHSGTTSDQFLRYIFKVCHANFSI